MMYSGSLFNIRIAFDKSHGAYIYDKNRRRYFLDFFGPYATLPLGYNNSIFSKKSFREAINRIAAIKIVNGETITDEGKDFFRLFSGHKDMRKFKHFYFCCTGGLAVESAIKTAIDQKKSKKPVIISLKESFHGISGYGGFASDTFFPVKKNLEGFPRIDWPKVHNPKIIYRNNRPDPGATEAGVERFRKEIKQCIKKFGAGHIAALLVEPIQSTYGDNHFPDSFFQLARALCREYDICLILDEIQTGFGATGKMWYHQHCGIEPDIVAFGKKSQVSGIMARRGFDKIFQTPSRLEVTWDGDLIDMVRCRHILEAYKRFDILENVRQRGRELLNGLKEIGPLKNVRGIGLLVAFDFQSSDECHRFCQKAFKNGLLFNKTRNIIVRLRPNLSISSGEIQEAIKIIRKSVRP